MSHLSRRSFLLLVCGLVIGGIQLSLLVAAPVQADVGAWPILPDGSSIQPEGETPIQMTAEKVVLTVRTATAADNAVVALDPKFYALQDYPVWYPAVAEVKADFIMKNPTGKPVNMTVWFPLASSLAETYSPQEIVPRIESFRVTVAGELVDYKLSELPNPAGADKPRLPWASFPVTFPAGADVPIQVSYALPAQDSMNEYLSVAMIFNYIFQTGAGWAGPIGKAELLLNLPYPASQETIVKMPEGGQVEDHQVRWTWENLEPGPQDDFSVLLLRPGRWDELQAARASVQAKPSDGQAWLELCATYEALGTSGYARMLPGLWDAFHPSGVQACQEASRFLPKTRASDGHNWLKLCATSYLLSLGEAPYPSFISEACQEATRLLPGDATPHYGLAILYLSALPQNPSLEELQPVLDELKIGQELESVQPASEVYFFDPLDVTPNEFITNWLNGIFANATATAESATATSAAGPTLLPLPSVTIPPTSAPVTETPGPLPALTPPAAATYYGQVLILVAILILIVLAILIYLLWRRMRGHSS